MNPRGPGGSISRGSLLGAFEVLSGLGYGGMGAVYRARNRITGDVRAIKVILPNLAANAEFVERFIREIRMAMAVEHPNLVRVFEPGMDGDRIFLPMELLEGETLAARLTRDPVVERGAAISLVESIGSALSALHARGIVHRDVKPSNIFLANEGGRTVPKLLDLGAGKEVGATEEVTAAGLAVGSPHYMAPEQAAGRKDIDVRVDQYSLAILGYQLLTGARPYENDDTGHVLAKVLAGAPYRTPREIRPDIPEGVELVILRGMSRARENRFPSIGELVDALMAAPPGTPSLVPTSLGSLASLGSQVVPGSTRIAPLEAPLPLAPPLQGAGRGDSGTMKPAVVPPAAKAGKGSVVLSAAIGVVMAFLVVGVGAFLVFGDSLAPGKAAASAAPAVLVPRAMAPSVTPVAMAPAVEVAPAPPPTATPAPFAPPSVQAPVRPPPPATLATTQTTQTKTHSPPKSKAPATTATAELPCVPTPGAPCL